LNKERATLLKELMPDGCLIEMCVWLFSFIRFDFFCKF
jgi:hypothetical protein